VASDKILGLASKEERSFIFGPPPQIVSRQASADRQGRHSLSVPIKLARICELPLSTFFGSLLSLFSRSRPRFSPLASEPTPPSLSLFSLRRFSVLLQGKKIPFFPEHPDPLIRCEFFRDFNHGGLYIAHSSLVGLGQQFTFLLP